MSARVILLNGVGSVGKTSVAKAIQKMAREPFLHVQMDGFIDMLPDRYQNSHEGFEYITYESQSGNIVTEVTTGPFGARLLRGMRRAITALADENNNLIVDEVLLGNEKDDYRSLLSSYETSYVGIFAPLPVIEEREARRGDRIAGLARWEYDLVHDGMVYDLVVDATSASPEELAREICRELKIRLQK